MEMPLAIADLKEKFDDYILETITDTDIYTIVIDPQKIIDIFAYLQEKWGFIFLTDLCGVHYPDRENPFGVVYHLHNMLTNIRLRIKLFLPLENPEVHTLCGLYSSANWMERETYDFFGIQFKGHPNLIRILNVEYLDYFPLRKEYPLEDPTREDKDNRFFGR